MSAFSGCLMSGNKKLFQEHWLSFGQGISSRSLQEGLDSVIWIFIFRYSYSYSNMQFLFRHSSSAWEGCVCFIQHALCCLASAHTWSATERLQDEALQVDGNIPFQPWTDPVYSKQSIYGQLHSSSLPGLDQQFIGENAMSSTPRLTYFMQESQRRGSFSSQRTEFKLILLINHPNILSWCLEYKYRREAWWHLPNGALGVQRSDDVYSKGANK